MCNAKPGPRLTGPWNSTWQCRCVAWIITRRAAEPMRPPTRYRRYHGTLRMFRRFSPIAAMVASRRDAAAWPTTCETSMSDERGTPAGDDTSDLPDPVVSPDAYDEHYYRNWCAGYEEWSSSDGAEVADLYPGSLRRAGLRPGDVLVDIGTGRGELL